MVSVAIMAIVAAMLMPTTAGNDQGRATAAARLLASDLEHAQMLALSRPDIRVGLHIDDDGAGWAIVDAANIGVPLMDSYDAGHSGRTLQVRLGQGRAMISPSTLVSPAGQLLVFTPLGGLESSAPTLKMASSTGTAHLSVNTDTGFTTLVE
jgi:type II secretory pathway pseudopilin PulG